MDIVIYTTGAYLVPKRVTIDGQRLWVWLVTHFEDDSFRDGNEFNPPETAKTIQALLTPETEIVPIGTIFTEAL